MSCRDYDCVQNAVDNNGCPNEGCEWAGGASFPGTSLQSFTGTPEAYVDLISENWSWPHGKMIVREMTDQWMAPYWEVWLVTGGWSENEETLDTLEGTWFYRLFWESTHRGGLMVFHVPAKKWTETMELGQI